MSSNNETTFQKHIPKYPLPEEILKMEKDETICQFCGVSYLIHNEIKKLEDRIRDLEHNLKDYENLKLKEKHFNQINDDLGLRIRDLEEKLTTRIQMISSLNNDIESRDLEVGRLKKKLQDSENENYSLIARNEALNNKILKYDSVVKETMLNLSAQKSNLKSIELATKEQLSIMTQYFASFRLQIEKYVHKFSQESHDNSEKEINLKSLMNSLAKENETNKEKINTYFKQVNNLQEIKTELESKITILTNELTKSKEMREKFISFEKEKRNYLEENSNLKNEMEKLKLKSNNLVVEISELNEKLALVKDRESLINKNHEKELKSKSDEIQKLKNDIEAIRRRFDEKEKFENEILSNNQSNLHEINRLKSEINRLNEEITDQTNERNAITIAHQCQIAQLKDSFKEKLKLSDDWPDKLAAELRKEREKHSNEKQKLELNLRENFKMELEIHQQKYNEMYMKYQQLNKENETMSKMNLAKLDADNQKLINELKNLHEEKLKNEKKLKQELEQLRSITKDLHERLEKHSDDNSDFENSRFKQVLIEKDTKIDELENKAKQFEAQLETSKEEIKVLQETVHNECLERQELLEKLDETRDELLMLKKNAYSSQQLIPLNGSITKSNFSKFKNGTGLIDYSYPKNLNELENQKLNNSQSSSSGASRRNSTPTMLNRTGSEKSNPESTSKEIENTHPNRTRPNNIGRETLSLLNTNGNMPTEPVQLFKKINQINATRPSKPGYQTSTLLNSSNSDNRKRISLLLARKS